MNALKYNYMKKTILMMCAMCAAVLVVFGLVGCEDEMDQYTVDAPADLQVKIDSIAAAKAGVNTGDTTYIDIATAIVGAEDFSSAWWTDFSDYFAVPTGQLLTLEFTNHNGGSVNNWNNWTVIVSNEAGDRDDTDNYAEYFALRSDAFGWGNEDFDLGLIDHNYPELSGTDPVEVDWVMFRSIMDGAHIKLEIDHSATGYAFITATATGTGGTELVMTYNHPVSATEDITPFLVADASYFEMEAAYYLPSQVTTLEDVQPVSIEITGAPTAVEIGNENFWGSAVATVTFDDGSSAVADSTDLSFNVVPDMTTVGEKTVVVAYSKTKKGDFTQAVSTYYTMNVTNSIISIAANNINYYYFDAADVTFKPAGIVVTATYSDNSMAILENSALDFDYPSTVSPSVGTQAVDITYVGPSNTFNTTSTVTFVQGTGQVGASDLSTAFWGAHSVDHTVASGTSYTFELYSYSTNAEAFHSPATILRKADLTEYGVVRMDNFGWGTGYDGNATLSNDWDFTVFAENISSSYIEITVTNNGDDTADIRYDVTYANGDTHFQLYEGIVVDSADLTCALTVDNCYLVLVN